MYIASLTNARRNVMWLADTNYRIDLENERVRSLAQADDYDGLVAADQVNRVIFDVHENVFIY